MASSRSFVTATSMMEWVDQPSPPEKLTPLVVLSCRVSSTTATSTYCCRF